jgi:hypothetical protein
MKEIVHSPDIHKVESFRKTTLELLLLAYNTKLNMN